MVDLAAYPVQRLRDDGAVVMTAKSRDGALACDLGTSQWTDGYSLRASFNRATARILAACVS